VTSWNPLLDAPIYPSAGYGRLADRLARLLMTQNDVLLVQSEAIVALEAAALSLARPGTRALNIVTSPYGISFGAWLSRGGVAVTQLAAVPGKPIEAAAVAQALDAGGIDVIAMAHAESASGILNPLEEIAALVRKAGALLVVDAVASFAGHVLDVDALAADVVIIGPQKSLGGASGISALSVSARAWEQIDRPGSPTLSVLSLADLRTNWLRAGRGALPGMPSAIEFHALEAALDRIEAEGIEAVIARHAIAGAATRAGLSALGLVPWVEDRSASNLVTAAQLPPGVDCPRVLEQLAPFAVEIMPAIGPGTDRLLRLSHTGPHARFEVVLANVVALGGSLAALGANVDVGAAAKAVTGVYAEN
jgi:aspartate aminotransferase-like enzyme